MIDIKKNNLCLKAKLEPIKLEVLDSNTWNHLIMSWQMVNTK